MSTKLAKKEEAGVPAELMDDILETAGEGTSYEADELQIPFVRVAQGTSPQLKKSDMKYIPDLRQGDVLTRCQVRSGTVRKALLSFLATKSPLTQSLLRGSRRRLYRSAVSQRS